MICLLLSFTFLCACNKDTNEPEPINVWGEEDDAYEVIPLEKKDFAIVYDENCDMDLYPDMGGDLNYTIFILSRSPIEEGTIFADALGTEVDSFTVTDYHKAMNYEWGDGLRDVDYNNYIYQTRKGLDWAKALSLFKELQMAAEVYYNDPSDEGALAAYEEATIRYSEYTNKYLPEFLAKKQELMDSHSYYVYSVNIIFLSQIQTDEVVTEVLLDIDGEQHILSIGRIGLHKPIISDLNDHRGTFRYISFAGSSARYNPWLATSFELPFEFMVEEDMTLNCLESFGQQTQFPNINVVITDYSGQTLHLKWDGNSPLYLESGAKVCLWVECCDTRISGNAISRIQISFILRYSIEAENFYTVTSWGVRTEWPCFDLCAVFLDGVDLRSYYVYQWYLDNEI